MFNTETARFTPLDFRLTAAAQFRLLDMLCSLMKVTVEDLQAEFLTDQLVTEKAISFTSLNDQGNVIIEKFETFKQMTFPPMDANFLVMSIIRLSPFRSALHTNKFHLLAPDPYYFFEYYALYPTNDHAIYHDVSFCKEVFQFISINNKRNRTDFHLTYY